MKPVILVVLSVALLSLAGCGHVIGEAQLRQVDRGLGYGDLASNPEAHLGKAVLTGGVVAGFESSGDVFEVEVIQLELLANGVPDEDSPSGGRFIGIGTGPVDQTLCQPGALITLVGEVKGRAVRKVQDSEREYPLLAIREVRLFRSSEPFPSSDHPYQNRFGDEKFLRRPPGLAGGEGGEGPASP